MKIKNIKINAFRGIPLELNIDLNGKSLLLLGENGTGKSSVIDAIEFFFTGKISHLRSRGTLALKDYGPNTKNPDKSSVSFDFHPEGNNITKTFNSSPTFPDILKDDVNLAKKGQFILRRSQILNLIDASPSERYKFISNIIGSDKLEDFDTSMFQARKYLVGEVKKIEANIENINEEINDLINVRDSNDILFTINQFLEKEGLESIDSIEELEKCKVALNEITKSSNNELIGVLNNISDIIKNIPEIVDKINQELSEANNHKLKIIKSHDLSELSLIKILKNSLEIINLDTDKCPLCENEVDSKELLKKINEKLEELESLKECNENLKEFLNNTKERLKSLNKDLYDLKSKIDYFDELKLFKADFDPKIESLNQFQNFISVDSFLQDEFSKDDFEQFTHQLEKLLEDIKSKSEGLIDIIKPSERDKRIVNLYDLFSKLDEKIKKQDQNLEELEVAKNRMKISEIIYSEFSEVKKRKIQEVYDTIKDDVERYYNTLHPQESYENIKLGIDPKKKGSTDLKMTIFGKEVEDPRALSSEGHLDSLGLCIFLALFNKAYKDFPLLVLDDVVTTLDSRHRENVCQLLFEEFSDKQFIITTHDGIWFDQLKAAQRVYNLGNEFRNYIIVKWDENYGPDIEPYKVKWAKIKENIENRDINCAGNEGRRYLEWLLKDTCNRTMAKIPAKESGKYEVGDLLQPAKSRLLKLINDEEYKKLIQNSFDKLDKTIMMGNLLSHDNLLTGNVSIDEVERFCNSVHDIDELLRCDCGAPLGYFRELKIFRCKNKKCSDPKEIKAK